MRYPENICLAACIAAIITPASAASPSVQDVVTKEAAILINMHQKASKALVNVAQDPAFSDFFSATDDVSRAKLKDRIDQISLRTQINFHVGEMCLIGIDGAERLRIVGQKIAADLDVDESHNAFFAAALLAKSRSVYVTQPYASDDSKSWVQAYATPIEVAGRIVAILHYEHHLDGYQQELETGLKGTGVHLEVVNENGHVVMDSANEPSVALNDKTTDDTSPFKAFALAGGNLTALQAEFGGGISGHGTLRDGAATLDVAYQTVQGLTLVGIRPTIEAKQVQD